MNTAMEQKEDTALENVKKKLILLRLEKTYTEETIGVVNNLLSLRYENLDTLSKTDGVVLSEVFKQVRTEVEFLESRKKSSQIRLSQLKNSLFDVERSVKLLTETAKRAEKDKRKCELKILQTPKK